MIDPRMGKIVVQFEEEKGEGRGFLRDESARKIYFFRKKEIYT